MISRKDENDIFFRIRDKLAQFCNLYHVYQTFVLKHDRTLHDWRPIKVLCYDVGREKTWCYVRKEWQEQRIKNVRTKDITNMKCIFSLSKVSRVNLWIMDIMLLVKYPPRDGCCNYILYNMTYDMYMDLISESMIRSNKSKCLNNQIAFYEFLNHII